MTGHQLHNFPAFDSARDYLNGKGWLAISPADIDRRLGINENSPPDITEKMMPMMLRDDVNVILEVDAMYMLEGWERSTGARAEHALAVWRRIPIYYQGEKL